MKAALIPIRVLNRGSDNSGGETTNSRTLRIEHLASRARLGRFLCRGVLFTEPVLVLLMKRTSARNYARAVSSVWDAAHGYASIAEPTLRNSRCGLIW